MPKVNSYVEVDQESYNRIITKLRKFEGINVSNVLKIEANKTVDKMWRKAPFRTGLLRKNIKGVVEGTKSVYFESVAIDPVSKIDYAPLQEFGTRLIKPKNYFFPNVHRFHDNVTTSLSNLLVKLLISKT